MKASRIFAAPDKDYAKAREAFRAVPDNCESYEKALVYAGVCDYFMGKPRHDYDAAIRVFDDYLNRYTKDPLHSHGAAEAAMQARRGEAIAMAVYYWGTAEFNRAGVGKGDWKRVIELLAGYEDRFPEQRDFSPAALYRVMIAQHRLGDSLEVEKTYGWLVSMYPTSPWTSQAALFNFTALETDYRRLKESKAAADQAEARLARRKLALYLEVGNRSETSPSFANLRRESQLWIELEEWAKAEALLRRLWAGFEAGDSAADIEKYILPDLGLALFSQAKMRECADVLDPLVEAKKATFETTRLCARALSGYAELTVGEDDQPRSVRVVAGVGGALALTKAVERYGKLLEVIRSQEGAWTRAWLELKFDQIYALHLHSNLDGKLAEAARAQIRFLKLEYSGDDLPRLQEADLKAKFLWLIGEVK